MPVFSPTRNAIFNAEIKVPLHFDGFPDFYALLALPRDAAPREIETAITSRAADLLGASFTRGGKSELFRLSNHYIVDLRPTLLDPAARAAYDAQLQLHERGDTLALSYEAWKNARNGSNRVTRGLKTASRGVKAHLKAVLWDAEYL